MKRSEMVEHIREELKEFGEIYTIARPNRKPHVLKNRAEGLLAMIEGFDMLPPLNENNYHHMDNQDRIDNNRIKQLHCWESEDG